MSPAHSEEPPKGSDLDHYQTAQAALYEALAQYQGGDKPLSDYGLALYHRAISQNDIEAHLVHAGGGSISSGLVGFTGGLAELSAARELSAMLVTSKPGFCFTLFSASANAQSALEMLSDTPPDPASEPAATAPEPLVPRDLTPAELEEVKSLIDQLVDRDPNAFKAIGAKFKTHFEVGKTPLAKAITTTEHAEWLTTRITAALNDTDEIPY